MCHRYDSGQLTTTIYVGDWRKWEEKKSYSCLSRRTRRAKGQRVFFCSPCSPCSPISRALQSWWPGVFDSTVAQLHCYVDQLGFSAHTHGRYRCSSSSSVTLSATPKSRRRVERRRRFITFIAANQQQMTFALVPAAVQNYRKDPSLSIPNEPATPPPSRLSTTIFLPSFSLYSFSPSTIVNPRIRLLRILLHTLYSLYVYNNDYIVLLLLYSSTLYILYYTHLSRPARTIYV